MLGCVVQCGTVRVNSVIDKNGSIEPGFIVRLPEQNPSNYGVPKQDLSCENLFLVTKVLVVQRDAPANPWLSLDIRVRVPSVSEIVKVRWDPLIG